MKHEYQRVPTSFGPETRFEVRPIPPAPFRALAEDSLEQLKTRLVRDQLHEVWDAESVSAVRRAANEAAALAWVSSYPLLVFPALFEEKVNTALAQVGHQLCVRRRSRELLTV